MVEKSWQHTEFFSHDMDCQANIMIIQEYRDWDTETQGTLHQQQMYSDPTS